MDSVHINAISHIHKHTQAHTKKEDRRHVHRCTSDFNFSNVTFCNFNFSQWVDTSVTRKRK